jgi:hypothetical protein
MFVQYHSKKILDSVSEHTVNGNSLLEVEFLKAGNEDILNTFILRLQPRLDVDFETSIKMFVSGKEFLKMFGEKLIELSNEIG